MRALVCKKYGPPSDLSLEIKDDPLPLKGQILVDVKGKWNSYINQLLILFYNLEFLLKQ